MSVTSTFDAAVPPARAFAFLSNPRNLITANNPGPIVEQSDGPLATGSWFVLQFDQLRARVEYTALDPDVAIAVRIVMRGRGSFGRVSEHEFALAPLDGGRRTKVVATTRGAGGARWDPIARAMQIIWSRRTARKMTNAG
jgi:hypothetical protein